jgi:hypothetical protein
VLKREEYGIFFLTEGQIKVSEKYVLGVCKIRPLKLYMDQDTKAKYSLKDFNVRNYLFSKYKDITSYVFIDFNETVDAIKNGLVDFTDIYFNTLTDIIYGFDRDLIENTVLDSDDSRFTIVKAIIWRINNAQKLLDTEEKKDNKESLRIQLFIDTHIDLIIYMLTYSIYDDEKLTDISENQKKLGISVLDDLYPHDYRFFYSGDLPDLTPCDYIGNIWYDVRPKVDKDPVAALIHLISSKTQHHKCQVRNFAMILYYYVQSYPVFLDLIKLILKAALLGNYTFCSIRADFTLRINLTYWINNVTDNDFFLWMHTNQALIYLATKLYYVYLVTMDYSLDYFLLHSSNWDVIKESIIKSSDICVSILSRYFPSFTLACLEIRKYIKSNDQENLVYITKLKKGDFIKILVSEINKVNEKIVINKLSTESQNSAKYLRPRVLEAINKVCSVISKRYVVTGKVEFKWLKVFGITKEGLGAIQGLYFEYEKLDIPDNSIFKRLIRLYESNPSDFHIIRAYFKALQTALSCKKFHLTHRQANNQMDGLRMRYYLEPWEEFPRDIAVYMYCENCLKWANPVVDSNNTKSAMNIYAIGAEKVLYDRETNDVYCGKQTQSLAVKKLQDSGAYDATIVHNAKEAKTIRKHKEANPCTSIPLAKVGMLGTVQELDDNFYALCEACSCLIGFECNKFNARGFTCNFHNPLLAKTHPPKIDFSIPNEMDPLYVQRAEKGFITKRSSKRCIYCDIDEFQVMDIDDSQLTEIKILNDTRQKGKAKLVYEDAFICDNDFTIVAHLFENRNTPQKTVLMAAIKAHRERFYTSIRK